MPGTEITTTQQLPAVSPQTVAETKQSISLLKGMVNDVLERGIDYGRIPGTPGDSLWDPGASMIISSFNCYTGQRRIISLVDDGVKIAVVLEVPIINRASQLMVGSGIGAASSLETKNKYRWVSDPQEFGYSGEVIKTFKTRTSKRDDNKETIEYRIPNPEHDELMNTLVKMASKRAEVDAAESLPGVSSVLRRMFDPHYREKPQTGNRPPTDTGKKADPTPADSPNWKRFYGELTRMGKTNEEAKDLCQVTSWNDWLKTGHSLDQALDIVLKSLSGAEQEKLQAQGALKGSPPIKTPEMVTEADVPTTNSLLKLANQFWGMKEKEVFIKLGYSTRENFESSGVETPYQAFVSLTKFNTK